MGGSTEAPPLTVVVQSVPDAPFILNPGTIPLNESERLNLTLLVLDPDMPEDSLTFSDTSDLFDVDPEEGTIDWTPGAEHIGTHTCIVTVEDSYGLTDRITLVIEVANVNDPPVVTSDLTFDTLEGENSAYVILAEDPDLVLGDVLTYSAWSLELEMDCDPSTGRVTFTTAKGRVGDIPAFVKVTDATGLFDQRALTIRVGNVNDPPTIAPVEGQTHRQGDVVSLRLWVDDPDLELDLPEPEVLTIATEGPEWLAPNGDGWVNLTVEQSMVGDHLVTYTVRDREGSEASINVPWHLEDVNDWPTITTLVPATVSATEDQETVVLLEATDVDGDDLVWTDDTEVFDVGATSGRIVFTPLQAHVGSHVVTVTVSDGRGGSATATFTLEVVNVNDPPRVDEVRVGGALYDPLGGDVVLTPGNGVTITVQASDEDGDELEYRWMHQGVQVASGTEVGYYGLEEGTYTNLTLVVDDGTDPVDYHLGRVVVRSTKDDEGSGSLMMVAILVCVFCAATLGIVYFMRQPRG
jgi:hypothetical protein